MADEDTPTPRIGRPPGTTRGVTPIRHLRVGQIWNDCAKQAKTDGQSMSEFVRDAITRELDRRRALAAGRPEMLSDRLGYPPQVGDEDWSRRQARTAPQCPACTSPYPHHRFALPGQGDPRTHGVTYCQHEWHAADAAPTRQAVGGWVYATPGARHCRCEYLGVGTPPHDVSALCVSLRPDADRDPEQAQS